MNQSEKIIESNLSVEDDPTAQPNIAVLFDLTERRLAQKNQRRRNMFVSLAFLFLIFAGGLWIFLLPRIDTSKRESNSEVSQQNFSPGNINVKSEKVEGYYVLRKIDFFETKEKKLSIELYDFDANRFLKGKDEVTNPQLLEKLLNENKETFKDSLIVIFTGASFEGDPVQNRNLCRKRGCYVGKLLTQQSQITADNLWIIAAGEYKSPDFSGHDEETREDEIGKSSQSEKILGDQRRLIIVTLPIEETKQLSFKFPEDALTTVVKALQNKELLPTSYDHGAQIEPTLLTRMNCN